MQHRHLRQQLQEVHLQRQLSSSRQWALHTTRQLWVCRQCAGIVHLACTWPVRKNDALHSYGPAWAAVQIATAPAPVSSTSHISFHPTFSTAASKQTINPCESKHPLPAFLLDSSSTALEAGGQDCDKHLTR